MTMLSTAGLQGVRQIVGLPVSEVRLLNINQSLNFLPVILLSLPSSSLLG